MILSDEELEKRLESPRNLVNVFKERLANIGVVTPKVLPLPVGGRREGDITIPPIVRELIGSLVNEGKGGAETGTSVAETFGVSQPTASLASRGLVDDRFDSGLAAQVKRKTSDAHNDALDMLMLSMEALKPKLKLGALDDSLKAKDLSRIATDMAKVVSSMKPTEKEAGVTNNTQVILFAPPIKKESDYEFIEA